MSLKTISQWQSKLDGKLSPKTQWHNHLIEFNIQASQRHSLSTSQRTRCKLLIVVVTLAIYCICRFWLSLIVFFSLSCLRVYKRSKSTSGKQQNNFQTSLKCRPLSQQSTQLNWNWWKPLYVDWHPIRSHFFSQFILSFYK